MHPLELFFVFVFSNELVPSSALLLLMVLGDTGNDPLGYIKKPVTKSAYRFKVTTALTGDLTLTDAAWGGYYEITNTSGTNTLTIPDTPGFWCVVNVVAISAGSLTAKTSGNHVFANSVVLGDNSGTATGEVAAAANNRHALLADSITEFRVYANGNVLSKMIAVGDAGSTFSTV